jgi:hypothetical protein
LVQYGLNPTMHVGDTSQTLLQFAVEAGARAESLAILEEAGRKKTEFNEDISEYQDEPSHRLQPGIDYESVNNIPSLFR